MSEDRIFKRKETKLETSLFDLGVLPAGDSEFELNGYKYAVNKRIVRPNVAEYAKEDVVWEKCHCPSSRGALMRCICYSVKKTCRNCNRKFTTGKEVDYCVQCIG